MIKINIARDFSDVLGGRYYTDGKYSGEEFYDTILETKFKDAKSLNTKLEVDLDGTFGYPSSFIDQSFGELGRKYGSKEVLDTLVFISKDQLLLEHKIRSYIKGNTSDG